jgi:nucleotide-binding universal stress UspA family protein
MMTVPNRFIHPSTRYPGPLAKALTQEPATSDFSRACNPSLTTPRHVPILSDFATLSTVITYRHHNLVLIVMFTRILVAVDGSPHSEKALEYAVDLGKKYNAKLMIVHVVLRRFYAVTPSEAGVLATTVFVKEMEAEGREIITRAEAYAKSTGADYECKMLQGVPAEEIVKAAQSEKVDLIVIGSRGLSEVRAFLLGSVSDKVSHHAKCPTLIVK